MTDRAKPLLRQAIAKAKPRSGETVALIYVAEHREPTGKMVDGFLPGYMVSAWKSHQAANWKLLRLDDGVELRFDLHLAGLAGDAFVIDRVESALTLFKVATP